jgi:hypothetical protein
MVLCKPRKFVYSEKWLMPRDLRGMWFLRGNQWILILKFRINFTGFH